MAEQKDILSYDVYDEKNNIFREVMSMVFEELKRYVAEWYKRLTRIVIEQVTLDITMTGVKIGITPKMKEINDEINIEKSQLEEEIKNRAIAGKNPTKSDVEEMNKRFTDIERMQLSFAHLLQAEVDVSIKDNVDKTLIESSKNSNIKNLLPSSLVLCKVNF